MTDGKACNGGGDGEPLPHGNEDEARISRTLTGMLLPQRSRNSAFRNLGKPASLAGPLNVRRRTGPVPSSLMLVKHRRTSSSRGLPGMPERANTCRIRDCPLLARLLVPQRTNAMTSFVVHGPFEICFENRKGGRTLVFDDFWSREAEAHYLAERRGWYVFAMRNRGLTPIYIGQATKCFKQETFNQSNRNKYHEGFSEYGKGTPVIYFVVHPEQRGRTNKREITQIEDFLIQAGIVKNPKIQNVRGAQQPSWSIKGVIRSGAGKRREEEVQFASLFDLQ